MNEYLRDRILRKLENLSDERVYQVLDYVEFLESKYAERPGSTANVFSRFTEAVEDRLRAGQVSASAVAETMNLMNKAMGVLSGVAAAGKSVANDLVGSNAWQPRPATATPAGGSAAPPAPGGPPPPAAPPSPAAPPPAAASHPPASSPGAESQPQPGTTGQPPGERRS